MSNSLKAYLEGRYVLIKECVLQPEYRTLQYRVVKVTGGFGGVPFTSGSALFCNQANGDSIRWDGWDVERFATDEEITEIFGAEAVADNVATLNGKKVPEEKLTA